jgi:MFS family permease
MAALACYGVRTSTGMVMYNSLVQAHVAADIRGRVFAGFDMLWQSGRLASIALGGLTADTLGIRAVYVLGGILLLLAGGTGIAGLSGLSAR